MASRSWVRKLFARTPLTARKAPARSRPRVEPLEDRTAPAVYTVTNALDDGSAGSLRDAINRANATPEADTIDFHSSLAGATIRLTQVGDLFGALVGNPGAFAITGDLTITGPTAASGGITIARAGAAPLMRLFQVYPGAGLTLQNLTLTGGVARGGNGYLGGGGGAGMGGAVFNNQGTLRLDNVTLANNAAIGGNSGRSLPNNQQIGGGFGGGPNGGGGGQQYGFNPQYQTPITSDSGGHGGFGGGGGAAGNASGIFGAGIGNGGWGGFGGGGGAPSWTYFQPTLHIPTSYNFFSNPGFGGFGGGSAGFLGDNPDVLGEAWGGGGAGMGGAIFNFFGTTVLNGSTLAGNSASGGAGGRIGGSFSPSDGQGLGGAVFNLNGDFRATNSTIAGNAAWAYVDVSQGRSFSEGGSRGGGVYNLNGTASFRNSTVAANSAAGASAIASLGLGLEVLTFGVVVPANTASIDLTNTLVAEAPAASRGAGRTFRTFTFGPAVALDTAFGGFSNATARTSLATSVTSPVAGLTTHGDLRLGPLGDNGGPTQTMALLPGSPAINAGDNSRVPAGVTTDQRGLARVVSDTVDVGAFEVQTRPPTLIRELTRDQAAVTGNEGSAATNTGTFDDPDGRGTVRLDASVGVVTKNDDAGTWNWSYTPADGPDGPTTVTITATNGGGLTISTTFTLTVNDVAPTIILSGDTGVNEGATYTLTLGAVTDPGADTVTRYIVSWGDGSSDTYTTGGAKTHVYADGFAGAARDITIDLVDEDGTHLGRGNPLSVTVNNLPPAITTFAVPAGANEGSPVGLSAAATDPAGAADPLTFTWTITRPDGSTFTLTGASVSFTPAPGGAWGVALTVTDGDGGSDTRAASVAVNGRPTLAVPAAQAAYEDVDKAITGIGVGDPDGANLTVTLAVGHGTLRLGTTTGLTVLGNGTGSVTLSGGIDALNAALASLVYRGGLNYSGADALSVTASDGSLSTTRGVAINVKSEEQQAADLRTRVNALKTAGVLNNLQAAVLNAGLNLRGNALDAVRVGGFLLAVEVYRLAGVLTREQADHLLLAGHTLLLSLTRR